MRLPFSSVAIADLVLPDADRSEDIDNTRKISAVVAGGRIFDWTALQKMLERAKASHLFHDAAEGNIEQVKSLIAREPTSTRETCGD